MRLIQVLMVIIAFGGASGCVTLKYTPVVPEVEDTKANLEYVLYRYAEPTPASVDHGEGFTKAVWSGHEGTTVTRMVPYADVSVLEIQEYLRGFQIILRDEFGDEICRIRAGKRRSAEAIANAIAGVAPQVARSDE